MLESLCRFDNVFQACYVFKCCSPSWRRESACEGDATVTLYLILVRDRLTYFREPGPHRLAQRIMLYDCVRLIFAWQIKSHNLLHSSINLTMGLHLMPSSWLQGHWKIPQVCENRRLCAGFKDSMNSRVRVRVSFSWTANQWKMEWTQNPFKYLKMFDFFKWSTGLSL